MTSKERKLPAVFLVRKASMMRSGPMHRQTCILITTAFLAALRRDSSNSNCTAFDACWISNSPGEPMDRMEGWAQISWCALQILDTFLLIKGTFYFEKQVVNIWKEQERKRNILGNAQDHLHITIKCHGTLVIDFILTLHQFDFHDIKKLGFVFKNSLGGGGGGWMFFF